MASKVEQVLSRSLREVLDPLPNGASIPESEELRAVLSALEYFLPEVLAEVYPYWKGESLDGVLPQVARKIGEREIEILGVCILMSDQTSTAIHLRLRVAADGDEVSWLECRMGEAGEDGMVRTDQHSPRQMYALECRMPDMKDEDWVYKVAFGQRRERK